MAGSWRSEPKIARPPRPLLDHQPTCVRSCAKILHAQTLRLVRSSPAPDRFASKNPPSSDPIAIYWRYRQDIEDGDQHSAVIARNRLGIIRGAYIRHIQGVVDNDTRQLIEAVAKAAVLVDFKPLLLVVPYFGVKGIVKPVDLVSRARPTVDEYIIEDLPRDCFDVIDLDR